MKTYCFLLLLVAAAVDAFTVQPAAFTPVTSSQKIRHVRVLMSNDAEEPASKVKVDEVKATGTFYDDEVEEYKDPLSDGMRQKLMREASSGLDSEKKSPNVILYISVAVVILIALAGQDILF